MNTTIKKKNNLSKNDIYPLIEGFDLFVNLSLVTYLCSYFLPDAPSQGHKHVRFLRV